MIDDYSIEEILSAVDDLQKIKKEKNNTVLKEESIESDISNIPKSTLKLIEEAEKSKKN
tara:strand:+ start:37 stop:213 length:177 start_codon:yes stop_codon:yes gene_type:complete